MDPATGEHVIFTGHPSWRGVLSFYVKAAGGALVLGALAALVTAITGTLSWPIVVLVVAVVMVVAALIGFVLRQSTTYTITDQRLSIRRGLLAKKVQQTHVERVQNVNTEQSPLDRMLRVGKVDFDTAGSDDSEFAFVGIADPEAIVAAVDEAQREQRNRRRRRPPAAGSVARLSSRATRARASRACARRRPARGRRRRRR